MAGLGAFSSLKRYINHLFNSKKKRQEEEERRKQRLQEALSMEQDLAKSGGYDPMAEEKIVFSQKGKLQTATIPTLDHINRLSSAPGTPASLGAGRVSSATGGGGPTPTAAAVPAADDGLVATSSAGLRAGVGAGVGGGAAGSG